MGELAALFLRLGVTAFGGPAAHIAMMHDEVVRRRGWVDEQQFLDTVGATNLVPGPNSTELAIHLGWERARLRGLVVAGVCFILPAALIVGVLAWAYVRYGETPGVEGLLYGVKPIVIAVVAMAIGKLAPTAAKSWPLGVLGVAAAAAYLLGVNELLLLALGGLCGLAGHAATRLKAQHLTTWSPLLALAGTSGAADVGLGSLFLVFLKIGSAGSPSSSCSTPPASARSRRGRCSPPPRSSATWWRAPRARWWRPSGSSSRRSCSPAS